MLDQFEFNLIKNINPTISTPTYNRIKTNIEIGVRYKYNLQELNISSP